MVDQPTTPKVRKWLSSVQARLDRVSSQLAPLLEKRERLRNRIEILHSLLSSLKGEPARDRVDGSTRHYVISRAVELLEEEGGPLHINELHARFRQRGYEVPGAGDVQREWQSGYITIGDQFLQLIEVDLCRVGIQYFRLDHKLQGKKLFAVQFVEVWSRIGRDGEAVRSTGFRLVLRGQEHQRSRGQRDYNRDCLPKQS